jgi:two-component system response regulator ResD
MSAREVWVKGKEIKLTRIEYELLITLLRKPNQAFSREQLIQNIWDYEFHGDVRTIDSHIKNLRYKLREVELQDRVIQTVWGYGYKWGVR